MNNDYSFKKLIVWQRAKKLVIEVYKITEKFPKFELFCLTSQIRRAVISVVANIAEGNAKKSKKHYLNFLNISQGSLAELDAYFDIVLELNYINQSEYQKLVERRREVGYLLHRLIQSL